jgi:hypothetical protein
LRAFLKAMKYCRRRDLADCVHLVFAQVSILDDNDLVAISTYLNKGSTAMNKAVLEKALEQELPPERKDRILEWLTEPEYEKAKAEAGAQMLIRLLQKRFGVVPPAVRQRIFAADVRTIEVWFECACDAPDVHSVFEGHGCENLTAVGEPCSADAE